MNAFIPFLMALTLLPFKCVAVNTIIRTPERTYILSPSDHAVLCIDHQTKRNLIANWIGGIIGGSPNTMHLRNNRIYVSTGLGRVYEIHFDVYTVSSRYLCSPDVDHLPLEIYKDCGYFFSKPAKRLHILDLKTFSFLDPIALPVSPRFMTLKHGVGYFLDQYDTSNLYVLDLEARQITNTLSIYTKGKEIKICDPFAYIVNEFYSEVAIVELTNVNLQKTIIQPYGTAEVQGSKFTAIHVPNGIEILRSYYLTADQMTCETIKFNEYPPKEYDSSLLEVEKGWPTKWQLCDPKRGHPLKTIEIYEHNTAPLQVGDDFYHRIERIFSAIDQLILFEDCSPIEYPLGAIDGDKAYDLFEQAIHAEDRDLAQNAFRHAFNHCHPKAFSVAAYAHFMGCLGAPEDFHLFKAYLDAADRIYFTVLLRYQGIPPLPQPLPLPPVANTALCTIF